MNWWKRFNNSLALRVMLLVGSVECVYLFAIFALLPIFFPQTTNLVQFVSSAFLQLILLPLIMVGQDLIGRNAELRAESDHLMLIEELEHIKAIHKDMHEILISLQTASQTVPCDSSQVHAKNL